MEPSKPLLEISDDQRIDRRKHLYLRCAITRGHVEDVANIMNVSAGGAMVDADRPPSVGDAVTLARLGITVSGLVAWVEGYRFGITFDRVLDMDALLAFSRRAG